MRAIFHPMTGAVIPSSRKYWSGPLWNTVCLQSFTQRTLWFTKTVVTYFYQFFSWRSPPICGDVIEKLPPYRKYLDILAVLGMVMELLRGAVLLEEVPQWGWALQIYLLALLPVHIFLLESAVEILVTQLPALAAYCRYGLSLCNCKPK